MRQRTNIFQPDACTSIPVAIPYPFANTKPPKSPKIFPTVGIISKHFKKTVTPNSLLRTTSAIQPNPNHRSYPPLSNNNEPSKRYFSFSSAL